MFSFLRKERGVFWTGVEKMLVYTVSFAQGIILARLIAPSDFGLAGMLGVFLGLGAVLSESGLGAAYVVFGGSPKPVFV